MFNASGFIGLGADLGKALGQGKITPNISDETRRALLGSTASGQGFGFGLTDKLLFTIFLTVVSVVAVKQVIK